MWRLAFVLASSLISLSESLNNRPIIGLLTETTTRFPGHQFYLAASYVKYIESAGARVVPIMLNWTSEELSTVLSSINGVLFPGGGQNLVTSRYFEIAKQVYQHSINATDSGQVWPVWGTCLGFEALNVITADENVLYEVDAENYSIPLQFTEDFEQSRMFKDCPSKIIQILRNDNVTMNNHVKAVSPTNFSETVALNNFYKVLSVNKDRKGRSFVSTMEAYKYPIYGVQWHPEKNIFEWIASEGINHSSNAVLVTQYMANFFVSQARMNDNHFSTSEEEDKYLIYRYSPIFTGENVKSSFEQCYVW
ncbi:gamma-glutamyl hydrolase-like [Oscarella lobularis]|uniref:gamma-glutamyl hydrolase-like n=1 Tax=Oscarella lobularis TaxID=121494 RepID=UPI003313D570